MFIGVLSLSPPTAQFPLPVFSVYNLTRSPLTAALYYLNAWNRLIISHIAVIINHEIASHADVLGNCMGGYHEMIIDICHSTGGPSSIYEYRRTSALLRNI